MTNGFAPLTSAEAYFELLDEARAAAATARESAIHLYLLADSARALIAEGRLLVDRDEGNLYVLEDLGTYARLSFIVVNVEGVRPREGLPAATKIECPHRRATPTVSETEAVVIERLGFRLGRDEARMVLRTRDIAVDNAGVARGCPAAEIRRARPDERPSVAALLAASFQPIYAQLPTDEQLEVLIAAGDVHVAVRDGSVVGALVGERAGKTAWIRQLAVAAALRGEGIGGELVDAFIGDRGDDVRQLMLWVDQANRPAIGLYESRGFRCDGREARIYGLSAALA